MSIYPFQNINKINNWTILSKSNTGWFCQCICGQQKLFKYKAWIFKTKSCGCLQKIDLIGQTIGKWKILKRIIDIINHDHKWLGQCVNCGTERILLGKYLQAGKYICVCNNSPPENFSNKTFGMLIALQYEKRFKENRIRWFWKCRCRCDNIIWVEHYNLKYGRTTSCGCQRGENLTGKIFNNWQVLQQDIKAPRGKNKSIYWLIKCQGCDTIKTINAIALKHSDNICQTCKNINNDITGKTFGGWQVLSRDVNNKWRVQCRCGTISTVARYDLENNKSTNCGCVFNVVSQWEKSVINYIIKLVGKENIITNKALIGRLRPDIVIPNKKLIIECNGLYWHSAIAGSPQDDKLRHYNRRILFESLGYRVIFLWEDDWQQRQSAIKFYLKNLLTPKKVPTSDARKLKLVTVFEKEAIKFMNTYHPQGAAYGKNIWKGLYDDFGLQACLGLSLNSRPVLHYKNTAELTRYASIGRVRGGASRLLVNMLKENPDITQVISFSDNDYFIGNMYETIGFTYNGEVYPDYMTVWGNNQEKCRRHKSYTKKANLSKLAKQGKIIFNPSTMTEISCLNYNNIRRCWNSGKKRWLYYCN